MTSYRLLYRLGITPWERYASTARSSIDTFLDREQGEGSGPPGRALDLGCGRGGHTRVLADRGWEAVGVDQVESAIDHAREQHGDVATFLVADVAALRAVVPGTFDLFLDVGCFQGLDARRRADMGREVTSLASPGATMLMLAFQPTRWQRLVEGASQADVAQAFPGWEMVSVDRAETTGLGWPQNRTDPQWYRLRMAA